MKLNTSNSHWFVSSCANWQCGTDLREVLSRMRRRDKDCGIKMDREWGKYVHIWHVPGPETIEYKIEHYAPQVEGAEYIGPVLLDK